MPPKETNKVSAGRAKVKATAAVASTASRASVAARATRASSPRTTPVSKPVASTSNYTLGAGGHFKPPVFKSPVQGGRVTQRVGTVNPRQGYESGRNEGLDLAADAGTPVIAGGDYGTVIGINPNSGAYGNQVIIQYPGGKQAAYNHLDSFGNIKQGQKVSANDVIGTVGSTGNTTGPHLDFEITKNGVSVDAVTAFSGYQFEGFNGGEKSVSDTGYNRSNNKFYSLGDLSKSPGGSVYASGSGSSSGSSNPYTASGSVGSTASNASTGFSGGQFVNLASLVAPGINRGMKKMSSPFKTFPSPSKSFSSKPFSSSSVGSTNSVGITPPTRNTKF